jgi:Ca2+:H+ antiporter
MHAMAETTSHPPLIAGVFARSDLIILGLALGLAAAAGLTRAIPSGPVLPFLASAGAVTVLASLVGRSVEQLGDRFGPGATGVLQSALGNLPELFIALFALRAGLVTVVQSALIGSILANLLLVLGMSFIVGGLKHGPQRLNSTRARETAVLMVLSVGAMVVPSLAAHIHTPAESHEGALSIFVSVILLLLFAVTLPGSLRRTSTEPAVAGEPPRWPLWLAVSLLAVAAVAAAFVSDWFVTALEPAMQTLHISEAFAGLVVVAIAGNAIENVVGVQLAAAGRSEYAFSVVIQSPLQIALVLAPVLVILSNVLGFAPLTLVFPPMLIAAVCIAVLMAVFITFDGESTWTEGAAMVGLYGVIAAAFWWG